MQIQSPMSKIPKRTPAGEALTALTMDLFRVNSLILLAGDRLAAHLDLTGARWQILGAIVREGQPQTVAWIARNMGGNRQNVQRIVNDLAKEGLVEFQPNPHHRRAHLVVLTEKGQQTYDAAVSAYYPRANALAEGLPVEDIKTAHRILLALRQKLEGENDAEKHD